MKKIDERIIIDDNDVEICWQELDTNVKIPKKTKREKEEEELKKIYKNIDNIYVPKAEYKKMKKEMIVDKVSLSVVDFIDKKCVKICNGLVNFVNKMDIKPVEQIFHEHDEKMKIKRRKDRNCRAVKYMIYEKMCK